MSELAMKIRVKRIGNHKLELPRYQTAFAAAFDLHAAINSSFGVLPVLIPTGFAYEIPNGYVGRIVGRSGMAKRGLHVFSGTIDPDYRGQVFVCASWVRADFYEEIEPGQRIAQMLIQPAPQFDLVEVEELSETERGTQGFGHTGVK